MFTLSEFKSYLNISNTTHDALLQGFINSAVTKISAMCNDRNFVQGDYTEVITSNIFSDSIYLKNTPINSVAEIKYYDGTQYADLFNSPDVLSDIFENLEDYLLIRKYYSVRGKNLRVVYNGGYKFVQGSGKLKVFAGSVNAEGILDADFTNIVVGDWLTFEGERRQVEAKTDTTHLTFTEPVSTENTSASYNISNVPDDLRQYCRELATKLYYESPVGKNMLLISNLSEAGNSVTFKDWDNSGLLYKYGRVSI